MRKSAKFVTSRKRAVLARAVNSFDFLAICEPLEQRQLLSGLAGVGGLSFLSSVNSVGVPENAIAVANLGNGSTDVVTENGNGTISLFRNNGLGTLQLFGAIPDGLPPGSGGSDSLAVADLGNGQPDIIVTDDNAGGDVSVLIGQGNLAFDAPVILSPGSLGNYRAESLVVANLGNGHEDIVTGGSVVAVYLGNGDGTFQPPTILSGFSGYADSLAVADVNGDGNPDLLFAGDKIGTLNAFLGQGSATFNSTPTPLTSYGSDVRRVVAAQLTASNQSDLIIEHESGAVTVFVPNGTGHFVQTATLNPSTNGNNSAIFVADVNGDGKPDIAYGYKTSNYAQGAKLTVFLGNGNGTFSPAGVSSNAFGYVNAATLADINGDGRADLILGYPGLINVRLANANATFGNPSGYTLANQIPTDVILADPVNQKTGIAGGLDIITANYNGSVSILPQLGLDTGIFQGPITLFDGLANGPATLVSTTINDDLAIAVTGEGQQQFSVILANGDGSFNGPQLYSTDYPIKTIAFSNLNGDGSPDLLVGYNNGTITVFQHNDEGFYSTVNIPVAQGCQVLSMITADVNDDGNPDLIVATSDNNVYEVLNNGDGTFQPATSILRGDPITTLAAGDFDGNGQADILAFDPDGPMFELTGNGDGTFSSAVLGTLAFEVKGSVAVADVNGDGHADLVIPNYSTNKVEIFLGNGNGTFQPPQGYNVSANSTGAIAVAVGDVNGDGRADIVVAGYQTGVVSILLGNTPATKSNFFSPAASIPVGNRPRSVAVGSLISGQQDVVVANQNSDSLTVEMFGSGGTLLGSHTYSGFPGPVSVALADVNGDGKLDIVVANYNYDLDVLINNGNGTFKAPVVYNLSPNLAATPGHDNSDKNIAIGDFLQNNRPSIVETDPQYGQVTVLHNLGNGTFGNITTYSVGPAPYSVAIGDLVTGSNLPDIVTANDYGATVSVLLNNGHGFNTAQSFFAGGTPQSVAIGDVNGDGKADLVVGLNRPDNNGSAEVAVLLGTGTGAFHSPTTMLLTGNGAGDVALAHINGDSNTDIVASSGYHGATTDLLDVLQGNGNGTFRPAITYSVPAYPDSVSLTDINGDGLPDVIAADSATSEISVLFSGASSLGTLAFTNTSSADFTVGASSTFGITTTGNSATTFSATGLPTGLSVRNNHNGSATIIGIPAAATGGTYQVLLSAEEGATGPNAQDTIFLEVDQKPAISSTTHATFATGLTQTFQVTASGFPVPSFFETGALPFGVNLDSTTGALTNSAAEQGVGGTYVITITATNTAGTSPNQVFTLTIDDPPDFIPGGTSATFATGELGTLQFFTTGFPAPTYSILGSVPAGISVLNQGGGDAELRGTPTVGGSFNVTVSASNAFGMATQDFFITVVQPVKFTSANNTTFSNGTAGTFEITTTGFPAPSISEAGLPADVTFLDNGDGTATLSNLPSIQSAGTFKVTLTANNGSTASQTFTLTADQPPRITSADTFTFLTGQNKSFVITATGFPAPTFTQSLTKLPAGLSFRDNLNGTAEFLGIPAASTLGTYMVTLTAANSVGGTKEFGVQPFTLVIDEAPAFTTPAKATFLVGSAQTFNITATGNPTPSITSTGDSQLIGDGLTFTDNGGGNATIAGTPNASTGGTLQFSLIADNGIGSAASQLFTLTIDQPPAITTASSSTFITSQSGTFAINSTGFPAPTITEKGTLPVGVVFRALTDGQAAITGTPGATTGNTYNITITAANSVGAGFVQSFALTVDQPAAIVTTTIPTFTVGKSSSFTVKTSGFPAVASISQLGDALPTGVSFTDNGDGTASVFGTPAPGSGGTYGITFSPDNGLTDPSASPKAFTLTVDEAPSITTNNITSLQVGTASTFTINTGGFPNPTLSEIGALPAGVTLKSSGGVGTLAGTPAANTGKTYNITVQASNGIGTAAKQAFTLTVNQPPSFTTLPTTTFAVGKAGTFTFKSAGFPTQGTFSIATGDNSVGSLGLVFTSNGDGAATLAGTPLAGTGGQYQLSILDQNGIAPSALQNFTLKIDQSAEIIGPFTATFNVGTAGLATISTTGFPAPLFLSAGILPAGVTFHDNHDGTATVSGTPAANTGRSYGLILTAFNGILPNAVGEKFILDVNQPLSFAVTNGFTFTSGVAGAFFVKTAGFPYPVFSETGDALPSGLSFTPVPGGIMEIAGKPAAATGGTYNITLTATNGLTMASQPFTITVKQSPAFTSNNNFTFSLNTSGTFPISDSAFPIATLTESGKLPAGLSFIASDNGTADFAGDPTASGTFHIVLSASNSVLPSATQQFTLVVH